MSAAAAEVGGPGLAGWLVAHFSAPLALAADAASFLVSALGISLIRRREPEPEQGGENVSLLQGIRTGLQVVYGGRRLRAIAREAATYNLFGMWIETLFVLYAVRVLGAHERQLSPAGLRRHPAGRLAGRDGRAMAGGSDRPGDGCRRAPARPALDLVVTGSVPGIRRNGCREQLRSSGGKSATLR